MGPKSKIPWTEASWNPVTGCTPISAGCLHCYAQAILHRWKRSQKIELHPSRLAEPIRWKRPRKVFVCSMSDLFHEKVPLSFIVDVYKTISATPRHTYQILTKRPERMCDIWTYPFPLSNVWYGVTVENQAERWRIAHLRSIPWAPGAIRFLSCEPLLGPLDLHLVKGGIQWVIVGGENGPCARPMEQEWVIDIRDQCVSAGVPFFFKGWGRGNHHREIEGQRWEQMPAQTPAIGAGVVSG
ncbi:hypothetical protein LCGC14_0552170 [marine sediment metagenome]|uniref:Phage Gp37Gp68 family protein n=1 Tax=marine sediment metagenome TaxID=412755 RepID=A0A0F9RUI8_9ZZZZ